MRIDLSQILPWSSLGGDLNALLRRLEGTPELVVFHENVPQAVLLSLERYEQLAGGAAQPAGEEGGVYSGAPIAGDEPRLKIGELVRRKMQALFEAGALPEAELANLCDLNYCRRVFHTSFAVLKPVDESRPLDGQRRDHNGVGRYYVQPFEARRPAFLAWLACRGE